MKSSSSAHQIPPRKRPTMAATDCEREKRPRMRRSTKNVAVINERDTDDMDGLDRRDDPRDVLDRL